MTSPEDRAHSAPEQEGMTTPRLWAAWQDVTLSPYRREHHKREGWPAPAGLHACVARFTATEAEAAAYADIMTVGEVQHEPAWAPELAIYRAARLAPRAVGLNARFAQQTHIRQQLMWLAGWCAWCNASSFIAAALQLDPSEVLL